MTDQELRKLKRSELLQIMIAQSKKIAELQEKLDALCKEYRTLDDTIQELNWTTELI